MQAWSCKSIDHRLLACWLRWSLAHRWPCVKVSPVLDVRLFSGKSYGGLGLWKSNDRPQMKTDSTTNSHQLHSRPIRLYRPEIFLTCTPSNVHSKHFFCLSLSIQFPRPLSSLLFFLSLSLDSRSMNIDFDRSCRLSHLVKKVKRSQVNHDAWLVRSLLSLTLITFD